MRPDELDELEELDELDVLELDELLEDELDVVAPLHAANKPVKSARPASFRTFSTPLG